MFSRLLNVPRKLAAITGAGLFLALTAAPASAQEPRAEAEATVDDIIVVARRSGAPMWEVSRDDGPSLILVGNLNGLPRDLEWSPDALEEAARRSQRVLFPPEGRVSPADVLRLLWRIRTISSLPRGTTTADYLTPEWQARLDARMAGERNDRWRSSSLLILGSDLLEDQAGLRRGGRDAVDVVRRASRRARVPGRPVGFVRGDELVESLISSPPQTHIPCLQAAIEAAEQGREVFRARAEAWRRYRVAEVVASPLDRALFQCWPWGDPEIGPQLRAAWLDAIEQALTEDGVTLAVAPLRLLAEPGGVLDDLEARGFDIDGPAWRPAEEAAPEDEAVEDAPEPAAAPEA